MNDQAMAAQQLAVITDSLVALFADYCRRNASPGLAELLAAYRAQRIARFGGVAGGIQGATP